MSANESNVFIKFLEENESFLLVSHCNPDGDALGSTIALGLALERRGKKVHMYNRDEVPSNLRFLPRSTDIKQLLPESVDVCILIDCSQKERSSKDLKVYEGAKKWACIDHHYIETLDSDIEAKMINENAAATGQVLMNLFKAWNEPISSEMAMCLYCAIVVDTGFFRYSNTTSKIFKIAEELVIAGADPWLVSKNIEENYPPSRLKLMGCSFATLEMELNDKFASISVTQKMLKESNSTIDVSDEFAVFPRSIAGVEVSALFRELGKNVIKVSLRSKENVDVAMIASKFGGGGHKRAAGCRLENMSIYQVKQEVIEAVREALKM